MLPEGMVGYTLKTQNCEAEVDTALNFLGKKAPQVWVNAVDPPIFICRIL